MREIISCEQVVQNIHNNKIVHNYQNTESYICAIGILFETFQKSVKKKLDKFETWCIICLRSKENVIAESLILIEKVIIIP